MMTILLIIVILLFLIQTPYVQNIVRGKAETYLSRKLHTRVQIGGLAINFPREVRLKDVYVEDLQKDTLLSAGSVDVNLRMWALLHSHLDIREVGLSDLTAKIKRRSSDSSFNFQFIINAFQGPAQASPPAGTSKGMEISFGTLRLDRVRFVYQDSISGDDAAIFIRHSGSKMETFDLDHLRFGGRFDMQGTNLDYSNSASAFFTRLRLGNLDAELQDMDLTQKLIRVKTLVLDSTSTAVRLGKTKAIAAHPGAAAVPVTKDTLAWRFTAGAISLNGDQFQFDDDNERRQEQGMDYAHLKLDGVTLHGSGLSYSQDSISGHILRGELAEQSGFRLLQLATTFLYTEKGASLQGLLLRTPGSTLQKDIAIQYRRLDEILKDAALTRITLDLPDSRIQVKDILTFAPFLRRQPIFARPGEIWQVNTWINGTLDALNIGIFQFSGPPDTHVDMAGYVNHPLDSRRLFAHLQIRDLSGSKKALNMLLPKGTLPSSISIPSAFDLHGRLDAGMQDVNTDLIIHTSSGNLLIKGFVRGYDNYRAAGYDLTFQPRRLDLGYILQDTAQWGRVTADLSFKGKGLDLDHADAVLHARVEEAMIRHYSYEQLSLDGSIAARQASLKAAIAGKDLRFKLDASADLTRAYPGVKLDWLIDTADLRKLHFVNDSLTLKGHIVADFRDTHPDSLDGQLRLAGIEMVRGSQRLSTDSIIFLAQRNGNVEDIQLHSEMADLDWKGQYKLTETGRALGQTIKSYYRFGENTGGDTLFTAQDWQLKLSLRPSRLLLAIMPSLRGSDTVGALVSFHSNQRDLQLALRSPRVQFGSERLNGLEVSAVTKGERLNYEVRVGSGTGSGFELYHTSLQGWLADNKLFLTVLTQDVKNKDRYCVAGRVEKKEDGFRFFLHPDSLMLNYDPWQVSRDNYIEYRPEGLIVHNFRISHEGQAMLINSEPPLVSSPIQVAFTDFHISTFTHFAEQDSLSLDGILQGKALVKNVLSNPVFTSDLRINSLTFRRDTVGDLSVKVNNEKANAFAADILLQGRQNDVSLKGEYYTGESRMNMKLDLRQLNLAAIRPFADAEAGNMTGYLKGALTVNGTLDKPGINGNLFFDSAQITPRISGEPLKLTKDKIEFDADGFNFSQFTLLDSAGNKLILDGNVYTDNYRDFDFDLSVNAGNFRLVNAPEESKRLFYGKLNLDMAANITGDMESPKVDGAIRVNKKTDFTFVLPESDPEVLSREGVVRFVDKDHPTDTLADQTAALRISRQTEIKGMELNLNIETDSSANFTMVIDERNGDALSVRGRSNLVFGIDKNGRMDLTGGYEIESGAYNLSFNVLKRKFVIQRGSTITWTGNATQANVDITAGYTANTPSIDLIENEISGRPQDEINKFKQKLPFLVTLKMTGDLLKPQITFDITLPPDVLALWPDVDLRLQQIRTQESEMNKQVFALLLLNRFVGEDPLQSAAGGGTSVTSLAFQSASQILTNQLDQFAASLIKDVDIHFDLNNQQDFTSGQEQDYTELAVTVSKRLFSDRVQVSVGSNFDVAGHNNPGQTSTNFAGNMAVDYKLTADGRYRVRGYRNNQYEFVVEGEVVETGVSFILTFDYDKFREIFKRSKEEKLEERKASKARTASKQ
jgi:hypothetical protein